MMESCYLDYNDFELSEERKLFLMRLIFIRYNLFGTIITGLPINEISHFIKIAEISYFIK